MREEENRLNYLFVRGRRMGEMCNILLSLEKRFSRIADWNVLRLASCLKRSAAIYSKLIYPTHLLPDQNVRFALQINQKTRKKCYEREISWNGEEKVEQEVFRFLFVGSAMRSAVKNISTLCNICHWTMRVVGVMMFWDVIIFSLLLTCWCLCARGSNRELNLILFEAFLPLNAKKRRNEIS